ncbi:MAG: RNA polymerase sigma factor [Cyclobacteriaceae bacterium]|nr:RNA polymerase sigma factor [Cyclobacteriaceae bacterium]
MTAMEFQHQIVSESSNLTYLTRRFTLDHDESKDLVQETILKALNNRSKFKPGTNIKGWLYIIMRNIFINNYRKAKRKNEIQDQSENMYYLNQADNYTFHRPDKAAEYNDVEASVKALSSKYREPFELHTEGYRYEEIAEKLDIPLGTVKNRIYHARKKLQEVLQY